MKGNDPMGGIHVPLNHDYGRKGKNIHRNLHKTNLIHEPEAGMTSNFCHLSHLQDMLRERSPVYRAKQLAVRADKAG